MGKATRGSNRIRRRSRRITGVRDVRQRFLTVCEGSQTEPNYFRAFQVPGCVVQVTGTTQRGVGLIKEAIRRRNDDEYDQVWCVFDRDHLQSQQILDAFQLANQNNIQIAFSNQAFELWYLLHFNYHHTAIPRQDYCTRLQRYLGSYNKTAQTCIPGCSTCSRQPSLMRAGCINCTTPGIRQLPILQQQCICSSRNLIDTDARKDNP
jgi:hypothetical protein